MEIVIKYHPLSKEKEFPSLVDIFRADNLSEPYFTEHIDSIGDLLDQRFYELLKITGEVKLRLEIIDE